MELFARSGNAFHEPLKSQMILDLILNILSGMSDMEIMKKYGNAENVKAISREIFKDLVRRI